MEGATLNGSVLASEMPQDSSQSYTPNAQILDFTAVQSSDEGQTVAMDGSTMVPADPFGNSQGSGFGSGSAALQGNLLHSGSFLQYQNAMNGQAIPQNMQWSQSLLNGADLDQFQSQNARNSVNSAFDASLADSSSLQDHSSPQLSELSAMRSHTPMSRPTTSPSAALAMSPTGLGRSSSPADNGQEYSPTTDHRGRFCCDHEACADDPPAFSRQSDWSKHMDKHFRPYVCPERSCEGVRGFTYSGGLLRHQREVHGWHGGPRASCYCPYENCKRSAAHGGHGFSRKENLTEHLRRVHHQDSAEAAKRSELVISKLDGPGKVKSKSRTSSKGDVMAKSEKPKGRSAASVPSKKATSTSSQRQSKASNSAQKRKRAGPCDPATSTPASPHTVSDLDQMESLDIKQTTATEEFDAQWRCEAKKMCLQMAIFGERMQRLETSVAHLHMRLSQVSAATTPGSNSFTPGQLSQSDLALSSAARPRYN